MITLPELPYVAFVGIKGKKENWWVYAIAIGLEGLLLCNLNRQYNGVIQPTN
jgi:hypothetical protein